MIAENQIMYQYILSYFTKNFKYFLLKIGILTLKCFRKAAENQFYTIIYNGIKKDSLFYEKISFTA